MWQEQRANGLWSQFEKECHINVKELMVMWLDLKPPGGLRARIVMRLQLRSGNSLKQDGSGWFKGHIEWEFPQRTFVKLNRELGPFQTQMLYMLMHSQGTGMMICFGLFHLLALSALS